MFTITIYNYNNYNYNKYVQLQFSEVLMVKFHSQTSCVYSNETSFCLPQKLHLKSCNAQHNTGYAAIHSVDIIMVQSITVHY